MTERANPFETFFSDWPGADLLSAEKTVPALRQALGKAHELVEAAPPPIASRLDLSVQGPGGDIPLRLYTPHGAAEPGPALIYFHGGGFVIGTLNTYDAVCQRLAAVTGVRVLSVDYRLAPEHPFPAAVEDAFAVFDAAANDAFADQGVDALTLCVGGDSAGGNLAASVARERRDRVRFQLLIYPLLQLMETKKPKPRWQDGPLLAAATLSNIRKHYLVDADPADLRVSPLLANDLAGLPPAYILAAELDPLLDEGHAYADRLAISGVAVEHTLHKGVPHGFLNASKLIPAAIPALEAAGRALLAGLDRG